MLNKRIVKFGIWGMINTATTYIVYLVFLTLFSYGVSYFLSYISGILISYIANSKWVFRTNMTLRKLLQYPLVYVAQFLLNLVFLYMFVDVLKMSSKIAPLCVTVISIPVTYLISQYILTGRFEKILKTSEPEK